MFDCTCVSGDLGGNSQTALAILAFSTPKISFSTTKIGLTPVF